MPSSESSASSSSSHSGGGSAKRKSNRKNSDHRRSSRGRHNDEDDRYSKRYHYKGEEGDRSSRSAGDGSKRRIDIEHGDFDEFGRPRQPHHRRENNDEEYFRHRLEERKRKRESNNSGEDHNRWDRKNQYHHRDEDRYREEHDGHHDPHNRSRHSSRSRESRDRWDQRPGGEFSRERRTGQDDRSDRSPPEGHDYDHHHRESSNNRRRHDGHREHRNRKMEKQEDEQILRPKSGDIMLGRVARIETYGAFVELKHTLGKRGLLHISEMATQRVEKVEDVVQMGQELYTRVVEVDNNTNKIRCSLVGVNPKTGEYDPSITKDNGRQHYGNTRGGPTTLDRRAKERIDQRAKEHVAWLKQEGSNNDIDTYYLRLLWDTSPPPPSAATESRTTKKKCRSRSESEDDSNSDSESSGSSSSSRSYSSSSSSSDSRRRGKRHPASSKRQSKSKSTKRRKQRYESSSESSSSSSESSTSSEDDSKYDRRRGRRLTKQKVDKNEYASVEKKFDSKSPSPHSGLGHDDNNGPEALRQAQEFKKAIQGNQGSSSDDDSVGPQPLTNDAAAAAAVAGGGHAGNKYGKALLPGEGEALAQFVQQNQRIPRRGEIGYAGEDIDKWEKSGFVMSGSRHARMNAVRIRKENQVYSAEEQRALALITMEEKKQKEAALIQDFRQMLQEKETQREEKK